MSQEQVESSQIRDETRVCCIARQILNYWTTREAPKLFIYFLSFFYFLLLLYFYFTILYWFCHTSTCIHQTPLPPPSSYHPSGSSQCTSPKHPASCIEPGLATRLIHDITHVSMPFSQIIQPPSPTESKRLFYTSVSLLLSCIQVYCYHLSKFHIYALVYCIGVFPSGLLHSV